MRIVLIVLLLGPIYGVLLIVRQARRSGELNLGCLVQILFVLVGLLFTYLIVDWEYDHFPERRDGVAGFGELFLMIWLFVLSPGLGKFLELLED
jgi:hypothetical protein